MTRTLRGVLSFAHRAFDTVCALVLLLAVFAIANVERMPDGGAGDFLSARISVKNVFALVRLTCHLGRRLRRRRAASAAAAPAA